GVSNATGSTGSEASASNAASSGGGVAESGAGNQKGALITDSVPNIIGSSAAAPVTKQKQAAVASQENDYDEAEVEAVLASLPPESQSVTNRPSPQSAAIIPRSANTQSTTTATVPVVDTRPVIGRYRVTSKANFYDSPDENTLRNAFIRQSN